jgi:hypothetical protein
VALPRLLIDKELFEEAEALVIAALARTSWSLNTLNT